MQPAEGQPTSNAKHTQVQLNNLINETLQIYELEDQKLTIIDDLNNSLQIITEFLGFSVGISPEIFDLPQDVNITMLPNLDLIIRMPSGKTETKKFSECSPEVISKIIEYAIPQLLDAIKSQKETLLDKITFLRAITKQLLPLNNIKDGIAIQKPEQVTQDAS
ncbi:MAG: hypothetical protein WAO91_06490 [Candidatus Nitrosotenuis sp.]